MIENYIRASYDNITSTIEKYGKFLFNKIEDKIRDMAYQSKLK